MKNITSFLTLLSLLFFSGEVAAQNPVNWSFTAKKIGDKTFEVHLTADVEDPWHIYSQTSPSGGALPTTISFNKNPLLILQGGITEKGTLIKKYEEVFAMELKYFESAVTFKQTVKLKSAVRTAISGSLEYMVCNDEKCLPPQTLNFSVSLK